MRTVAVRAQWRNDRSACLAVCSFFVGSTQATLVQYKFIDYDHNSSPSMREVVSSLPLTIVVIWSMILSGCYCEVSGWTTWRNSPRLQTQTAASSKRKRRRSTAFPKRCSISCARRKRFTASSRGSMCSRRICRTSCCPSAAGQGKSFFPTRRRCSFTGSPTGRPLSTPSPRPPAASHLLPSRRSARCTISSRSCLSWAKRWCKPPPEIPFPATIWSAPSAM